MLHRLTHPRVGRSVLVQVGSRQQNDDATARHTRAIIHDGLVALAGMNRHQEIAAISSVIGTDRNGVTELAQYGGPPLGGDAVAGAGAARCRRDETDFQPVAAHVRKPANTSRRCGS